MKHLLRNCLAVASLCVLQLIFGTAGYAQVQTARPNTFITENCKGFYEYLPQGYGSGTQQYPLLIFFHGSGEVGDGSPEMLKLVLRNGPPHMADQGTFPSSSTVNGTTFRFVMLSPQFLHWADRDDINAVIDYALRNYRINPSRIYLTGLSMGGGSILEFAGKSVTGVKRIAALTTAAGAYGIDPNEANNLASVNLPVWATHNSGDGTVGVEVTIRNVDTINNYTRIPPTPRAKKTIFNVGGHDAWSQTYDPNFRDNGLNVYEWMLQFQLGITSPLPVIMGEYTAFLSDESAVTVNWTTVTESHNKYFVLEKSTDGARFSVIDTITAFNQSSGHAYTFTDRNVAKGNNFYRLSQVDDDGKITYFKVLSVLVPVQLKSYFKISPNPASAAVLLDLMHPETGSIQVVLSDMQGRTIRTWKFEKQNLVWQQSLDVSSLAPGNYTILLKGNTISQVQRLVKQ